MANESLPESDHQTATAKADPGKGSGWSLLGSAAVFTTGIGFCIGTALKWEPLNGLSSLSGLQWPWRDLDILKTALTLSPAFFVIVAIVHAILLSPKPRPAVLLPALVTAALVLQILGITADPKGLALIPQTVSSTVATSYYGDAATITDLRLWLRHFPDYVRFFHSTTHPPGPVLFYYVFVKLFGRFGALSGGIAVGIVASLGIAVMYAFAGLWTSDVRTRLLASALFSINPALVLFFPELDQVYPILSMLMILLWARALNESPRYAFALGLVLFTSAFMAYNLGAAGVFLAWYAVYWIWSRDRRRESWVKVLSTSAIAGTVLAAVYLLLWLATGFNPLYAFRRALQNQTYYAAQLARPWAACVFLDLYDFVLGAGILVLPILVLHLRRYRPWLDNRRTELALTLIGLTTVLTIDVSGLLRAETARVWMFLQPLLIVPVALELMEAGARTSISVFALECCIIVVIKARMTFLQP